jgi:hypothetical protein
MGDAGRPRDVLNRTRAEAKQREHYGCVARPVVEAELVVDALDVAIEQVQQVTEQCSQADGGGLKHALYITVLLQFFKTAIRPRAWLRRGRSVLPAPAPDSASHPRSPEKWARRCRATSSTRVS